MTTVEVAIVDTLSDERRRTLIYDGALIIFRRLPAMVALCELVQAMACEILKTGEPPFTHRLSDEEEFSKRVAALQFRYATSPETKRLLIQGLRQAGVDPDNNCLDASAMRVQPPANTHVCEETIGLGPHRDVWYGCPVQQHNWWGPFFPIDAQSCLAFYPQYWAAPIKNSSAAYSMEEFSRARAEARKLGMSVEEMEQRSKRPLPTRSLNDAVAVKLVMQPGDLACFSSAQLHYGIPNTTTRTRFSGEVRTIHVGDVEEGIGAPCADSFGHGSSIRQFGRICDGRHISDLLSAERLAAVGRSSKSEAAR